MTTARGAFDAIRARLLASDSGITIPLYWQNDFTTPLPADQGPFAYVEFINEGSGPGPASYGDGVGMNRYRNRGRVEAYVFVSTNSGADAAMDYAETIAARLRSHRDSNVFCTAAHVSPLGHSADLGLSVDTGNYWAACVEVSLTFDQIG